MIGCNSTDEELEAKDREHTAQLERDLAQTRRQRDAAEASILAVQARANGMQEQLLFALQDCAAKDKRIAALELMLRENLGKDEEVARLTAHTNRYLTMMNKLHEEMDDLRADYKKRGDAFKRRRKLIATLEAKVRSQNEEEWLRKRVETLTIGLRETLGKLFDSHYETDWLRKMYELAGLPFEDRV